MLVLVLSMLAGYTRSQDNQILRISKHDGRVMTAFGNAPEHASLYRADLRVPMSGDMVLLSDGKPFRDLHTRIKQLCDHHAARLA